MTLTNETIKLTPFQNRLYNYSKELISILKQYDYLFHLPIVNTFINEKTLPKEWEVYCYKRFDLFLEKESNKYIEEFDLIQGKENELPIELIKNSFINELILAAGEGTELLGAPKELNELIQLSKKLSLDQFLLKNEHLLMNLNQTQLNDKLHLPSKYLVKMSPKKQHEVITMTSNIAKISKHCKTSTLIDIGSGQGYLTRIVHTIYNLNALGLDGDPHQTKGALNLDQKLLKHQKKDKLKEVDKFNVLNRETLFLCKEGLENFNQVIQPFLNQIDLNEAQPDDDKSNLMKKDNFILSGLHTCGDLAYTMLELFKNTSAKALVSVGCCYHKLLNEQKDRNHFQFRSQTLAQQFQLPYLGLKMSCQAPSTWSQNPENCYEFFKRHFYRALLQKYLVETQLIPETQLDELTLGKMLKQNTISPKQYINSALSQLNLKPLPNTDELIDHLLKELRPKFYSICLQWMSQALLAPLIEALLVADRTFWLIENLNQDNFNCYVEVNKLFDPLISPRCYAVIAWKLNPNDLEIE